MENNFWRKLPHPFLVLAPMDDITNLVFRKVVLRCGRPDVFFTEFVSADGIASGEGRKVLLEKLKFSAKERPIVAQFFGANPDHFETAARLARELGFDGIDINMGCPDASVTKQGAGSALIKNSELALKIIRATKKGAGQVPVSVKTRIGWTKNEVATWIPKILDEGLAALTIHGRTAKDTYAQPADWEAIAQAVALSKKHQTVVIGNGDLWSVADARERAQHAGVDGAMIGRAALKNPWIFDPGIKSEEIGIDERLKLLIFHCNLFREKYPSRNFSDLKKFFAGYVTDFPGAKQLRIKLMEAESVADVKGIISQAGLTPDNINI